MKTLIKWVILLGAIAVALYYYTWPRPIEVSSEQVPAKGADHCPTCEGTGHSAKYEQCQNCKGSGHTDWRLKGGTSRSTKPICQVCSGTGQEEILETCPTCNGKGGLTTLIHIREGLSLIEKGLLKIGIEAPANPAPVRTPFRKDYPIVSRYLEMSGGMKVTRWAKAKRDGAKWIVAIRVTGEEQGKEWTQGRRIEVQDREVVGSEEIK
jgi:hypothetical protein